MYNVTGSFIDAVTGERTPVNLKFNTRKEADDFIHYLCDTLEWDCECCECTKEEKQMNIVSILENSEYWSKATADSLPKNIDAKFLFVIEDRIGTTRDLIDSNFAGKCDYEVITSSEIIDKWEESHPYSQMLRDDKLSSNVMTLWYIYRYMNADKALLLDDDVILKDGFEDVFSEDYHLFGLNPFPNKPTYEGALKDKYWHEWLNIFSIPFTEENWKKIRKAKMCTGVRMINLAKLDINRYEYYLEKFYNSEYMHEVITRYWTTKKNKCKMWFLTEYFEQFFYIDEVNNDLKKKNYCSNIFEPDAKITDKLLVKHFKNPIIHFPVTINKTKICDKAKELNLL